MKGIYRLDSEKRIPVEIKRMYRSHGPYLLGEQRLDTLSKVSNLVDSSTTTRRESGTEMSSADASSVIGRAVVGGILAGGAGAIIGGNTAKKVAKVNSVTTEVRNTELTLELQFSDASPINVVVTSLDAYHWLLGQAGGPAASEEQLMEMKSSSEEAQKEREAALEESARWAAVDRELQGSKPKPRDSTVVTIAMLFSFVGAIAGLMYGDHLISKLFFGVIFFHVVRFGSAELGYLVFFVFLGSEAKVNEQYENERKRVYQRMYQGKG